MSENLETKKFDPALIEKEIPYNMRAKGQDTTLDNDGGIYWVTMDHFTLSDIMEFQAAMIKFDIPKAYVTVRDYSGCSFDYDKANGSLIEVTQDAIDYTDYNITCVEEGDPEAMMGADSEDGYEDILLNAVEGIKTRSYAKGVKDALREVDADILPWETDDIARKLGVIREDERL